MLIFQNPSLSLRIRALPRLLLGANLSPWQFASNSKTPYRERSRRKNQRMDGYPPQHQMYVRPPQPPQPPPSPSDPHQYQHYQHLQTPSAPPQNSWYSNQFQFQPPHSHSPSPTPPHHWVPSPHAPLPPLPPPPPPPPPPHPHPSSQPYPTQVPSQNHQFPPRLHAPPPTPTQSYTQERGNPNWGQRQARDYAAHNNAEDWAAKARAWAAAKQVAIDDQHPPPQMASSSRPEELSHYYNQFSQDHYQDVHQHAFPASGYQQFPASASAPSHQAPFVYVQDTAHFSTEQSSYVAEGLLPGSSAGAPITGSFVHQQEVPSNYSSVTGMAKTGDQNEQLQRSLLLPASQPQGGQHLQPSLSAMSRSLLKEEPLAYVNYATGSTPELSDRPLNVDPGYNHNHDPHMLSSYTAHHDSARTSQGAAPSASVPFANSWTPAVTSGTIYPQISSVLSSGPQHDPTAAVPSPVPGHASSAFGSFSGSNYQTIPPTSMPYGLSAGPALHQTAGFPGDTYGVSNVSERPKKASVPNWLKDEIIKKASVMTRPPLGHTQEETLVSVDKSFGKSDLTDSKSVDSSRSTEGEEDDEDYAEAARAAAINQEIKRILTEVLLKVTDELFDEIATTVLDEEDLTVEGEHNSVTSNHELSSSPPAVPIPMASANVLVPVKAKESETEHVSEESSSGSVGDILGLANYASDEDNEGIQSNEMPNSKENTVLQQSSTTTISEGIYNIAENGMSQPEPGKHSQEANLENDVRKTISIMSNNNSNAAISELNDCKNSLKVVSQSGDFESSTDGGKRSGSNKGSLLKATPEDATVESGPLDELVSMKKLVEDDFGVGETGVKSDQDNGHEIRSHSAKEYVKEAERSRAKEKVDANHHRQNERNQKKESKDVQNGPKDRKSERVDGMGEKAKEPELHRRASGLDAKKVRKEAEKSHGNNVKEDTDRKRERANNKDEDRARYKLSSDTSKYKRRRSSSINSRGRSSKYHDSSDEESYDSKRKQHSRKRQPSPSPSLSPSPVRSGRRQVSRSPHSKHSQRRHSPYSSLANNRGRRSRSKSPVRRRR